MPWSDAAGFFLLIALASLVGVGLAWLCHRLFQDRISNAAGGFFHVLGRASVLVAVVLFSARLVGQTVNTEHWLLVVSNIMAVSVLLACVFRVVLGLYLVVFANVYGAKTHTD